MEANTNNHQEPILKEAWMRHAELDANAGALKKRYTKYRKWVLILGILATFLAIFTSGVANLDTELLATNFAFLPISLIQFLTDVRFEAVLKVLLIATPLGASLIAAYTSREMGDGRWLAMRAGSEEVWKDIYIYRTVLAKSPHRNRWLSNRLAAILRQVYKSSGNKLDTEPYEGKIPVHYYPDDPNSDPGFKNLTPDEYIRYRLTNQLDWHERKLVKIGRDKQKLTLAILGMGAMGALLAGIGEPFAVWVALTASITAALTGWEELQNREATIANYSKVKLELTILKDHWYGLREEERTEAEFYKLVLAAENLLWMQNAEYIRSMQEALATFEDEDARLVEDVVRESETMHQNLQQSLYSETASVLAYTNEELAAVIDDAGASVEEMVSDVSTEARAYTDSAEKVVDTAVAESAAMRSQAEAAATSEVEAWGEAAEESVDLLASESAVIRKKAKSAVTDEAEAWRESAEQTIEDAAAESAAMRQTADTAVDSAAETAATVRETALNELESWEESADDAIDRAKSTSERTRQAADSEVAAWQETAAETIEAASDQSSEWRESAEEISDTAVGQSEAWQKSAAEAVDAATAESEAWRETTEHAVDSAVDKSKAAREAVDRTVKYAIEFKPAVPDADELGDQLKEEFEEVVYTAETDVKYPINFKATPTETTTEGNGNQDSSEESKVDEAVNEAVDRILQEGVNIADDAIRDALAKAAQEENNN